MKITAVHTFTSLQLTKSTLTNELYAVLGQLTQAPQKAFPSFGHANPDNEIKFSSAHSTHRAFFHGKKYLFHSLQ